MIYDLLLEDYDTFWTGINIFISICVIIIIAVLIDFIMGCNASEYKIYSKGIRKSMVKLSQYYGLLLSVFLIDVINPVFMYIEMPNAPIITIVVGIFILSTEALSVREHLSKNTGKRLKETPKSLSKILNKMNELSNEVRDISKDTRETKENLKK